MIETPHDRKGASKGPGGSRMGRIPGVARVEADDHRLPGSLRGLKRPQPLDRQIEDTGETPVPQDTLLWHRRPSGEDTGETPVPQDTLLWHRRPGGEDTGETPVPQAEIPPTYSIVIPCLDEEDSLPALICQIEQLVLDHAFEVVFVDDGSTDGTWGVVADCLRRHPRWRGVRLSRRFGHQSALLAGLSAANGRAVITLDADGQHPVRLLPEMFATWRSGAKVVQMIRLPSADEPWVKRVTSRLFYRVFSILCDVRISPAAADFRLLDRDVVELILRSNGPVPFLRGLIPWLGCKTRELTYTPDRRAAGETKYSLGRMVRLAMDGLMSFSIVPLRLGIWAGLFFGILSFAYLCYVVLTRLFNDAAVPGWASTAGMVALLGGVQLFCIGLLGEYLGRLYVANMDRPRFVVQEMIAATPLSEPPRVAAVSPPGRRAEAVPSDRVCAEPAANTTAVRAENAAAARVGHEATYAD